MDFMVDIETLATDPDATVLSIGATAFSTRDGVVPVQFYAVLALDQQKDRTIDPDTVQWWLRQAVENEASIDIFTSSTEPLDAALGRFGDYFHAWCDSNSEVWANDPSFDCVILRSLFKDQGMTCPWNYWRERSFRTLKSLGHGMHVDDADLDIQSNMHMHNALADAVWQAEYCIAMQNEMGVAT